MVNPASLLIASLTCPVALSGCPYLDSSRELTTAPIISPHDHDFYVKREKYYGALEDVDFAALKEDLLSLFRTNDESWPMDYDSYAPLFVRLAWHCSGSYRSSDGRGGCSGGRQRFEPERSWDDNTNLDKARRLLEPLKSKYGEGLSYGDLYAYAGTVAIESMGGPVLDGFCAGRVDADDGSESIQLGPSDEQEALAPCDGNEKDEGNCQSPLGATVIGLIYVNPEGPDGQPYPNESALHVRDTFERMTMNDTETVALIAGGHTFGKTHGPCKTGAGPAPSENPDDPSKWWPGTCGDSGDMGKGNLTFTSGFEGPWTSEPTIWSSTEYFTNLMNFEWQFVIGPGGRYQWETNARDAPEGTMMLTSDMSLSVDPEYVKIVRDFMSHPESFEEQFAHAWYKLTTRDLGPVTNCRGNINPPPAQPFQYPLPDPPKSLPDFDADLRGVVLDLVKGDEARFLRLAVSCAQTVRVTDFQGGCNGSRIRLLPESGWAMNAGVDATISKLDNVYEQFKGEGLTFSDLIVFAGGIAIESASASGKANFCPGRSDAESTDAGSGQWLQSRLNTTDDESITPALFKDVFDVMGFDGRESVALIGGLHSVGSLHCSGDSPSAFCIMGQKISGLDDGSASADDKIIDNGMLVSLMNNNWTMEASDDKVTKQYRNGDLIVSKVDIIIKNDTELSAHANEFAADNDVFLDAFVSAFVKLMNSDRYGTKC